MDYDQIDLNIKELLNGVINTIVLYTIMTNLTKEDRLEFYEVAKKDLSQIHQFIFQKIPDFMGKLEETMLKLKDRISYA